MSLAAILIWYVGIGVLAAIGTVTISRARFSPRGEHRFFALRLRRERRAAVHGHTARVRGVLRGVRLVDGGVFLYPTGGLAAVSAEAMVRKWLRRIRGAIGMGVTCAAGSLAVARRAIRRELDD